MKTRSRRTRESNALVRDALRAVIEGDLKSACVTLTSQGEACHVTVINKGGKVEWEKTGGLFAKSIVMLCGVAGMHKSKPLPHSGLARCAFGSPETGFKSYPLEVIVKGKAGPVELRLGEPEVT